MITVNIIKEDFFFPFIHEYFCDMPEILFLYHVFFLFTSLFNTAFLPAYSDRILSSFKPVSQF